MSLFHNPAYDKAAQQLKDAVTQRQDVPLPLPDGMTVEQAVADLVGIAEHHRDRAAWHKRCANRSGTNPHSAREAAQRHTEHKAATAFARQQIRRIQTWAQSA